MLEGPIRTSFVCFGSQEPPKRPPTDFILGRFGGTGGNMKKMLPNGDILLMVGRDPERPLGEHFLDLPFVG